MWVQTLVAPRLTFLLRPRHLRQKGRQPPSTIAPLGRRTNSRRAALGCRALLGPQRSARSDLRLDELAKQPPGAPTFVRRTAVLRTAAPRRRGFSAAKSNSRGR